MTDPGHAELIDAVGPQRVVDVLAPYLTDARKGRIAEVLGQRMSGVSVAVEAPSNPHNAAAIVRTAEALGALSIHVVAAEGNALHAKSTTQGAFHWVDTHHHDDLEHFLAEVRQSGTRLAGAWMDAPIPVDELPCDEPICLLFGNEERGLSAAARSACDYGFRVPMFGMSESLNLSVTAAISLHDILGRRRAVVGPTDLDDPTRARLRARAYLQSVDRRLAEGLLAPAAEKEGAQ